MKRSRAFLYNVPMTLDDTLPVRVGEELDSELLASYLSAALDLPHNHIDIRQFPAGSSNLTYFVSIGGSQYVLRRPPFGNTVKSAHDMHREFIALSRLSLVYPPAPKPLLLCEDESVIGSPFYLMELRRGLIIRGNAPQELTNSAETQRRVCRAFVEKLAKLHSLDFATAGLADLGRPEGYTRRQVEGWTKRYIDAKTDEWPELETAAEWLNRNIPKDSDASIVHNDYKFDNVMLDPNDLSKIVAVLDWEMVTIGDPLMDLGTTLGYWLGREGGEEILNMPFNPRVLRENISRHELVEMYAEASGRNMSNIVYYFAFGLFKIAVIAQQIYARYIKGSTRDRRFAHFDRFVGALGKIAENAIDVGHI